MIDPRKTALFTPPGLARFKLELFTRIGKKVGHRVMYDPRELDKLPDDFIPIVGCTPALRPWYDKWRASGRKFIYWDRGYLRRVFATWLPNGAGIGIRMGFYRWHLCNFQMQSIEDVSADRWEFLRLREYVRPWNKDGKHIVIADTLPDYWNLFCDAGWTKRIADELRKHTDRPIRIRDKESKVNLFEDLKDAHCLVAHGSIAAVESAVMGCPVFVDKMSAASLVGLTDFSKIETPVYPERESWLRSLAYNQWHEGEMDDGTLWRMIH